MEVRGSGPMRLLDAGRAHGGVAATRAMGVALELSETYGIGAVGVRNSTHLGAAGYFAELATEQGCIGVVFTNAGPEIAPWGATEAVVGTNPWAVAVPTRQGWPVVLDMANSTSGKGMVRWNQLTGDAIPDDWALTTDGQRTTDPVAALAGTLFPLGGPKGYAMAVIVDLLTGALTGSAIGKDCFDEEHQDVGHLVLALRIEAFRPLAEFLDSVELLIDQIRRFATRGQMTQVNQRVLRSDPHPGELGGTSVACCARASTACRFQPTASTGCCSRWHRRSSLTEDLITRLQTCR